MKKSLWMLTLVSPMFLLGASCTDGWICRKGDGPVVEESRTMAAFDRVELEGSMDLFLVESSEYRVVIEAEANLMEVLSTEVKSGELRIRTKDCFRSHDPIRITVYAPVYRAVTLGGSGKIESENTLHGDDLSVSLSGSGKVALQLVMADIDLAISGSGRLEVSGECVNQSIAISGSGQVENYDLNSSGASVNVSGSGNCRVRANDHLSVRISGSGSVWYRGYPSIEEVSISGSGRLIEDN